jgi:hypothetical protein
MRAVASFAIVAALATAGPASGQTDQFSTNDRQAARAAERAEAEAELERRRQEYCGEVGWQQGGTCLEPFPNPQEAAQQRRETHRDAPTPPQQATGVHPQPPRAPSIHVPESNPQGPPNALLDGFSLTPEIHEQAPNQFPSHMGGSTTDRPPGGVSSFGGWREPPQPQPQPPAAAAREEAWRTGVLDGMAADREAQRRMAEEAAAHAQNRRLLERQEAEERARREETRRLHERLLQQQR